MLSQPPPGSAPLAFETEYPQSARVQFLTLLRKNAVSYWRNVDYNAVRYVFTIIFALQFATVFWDTGGDRCAHCW